MAHNIARFPQAAVRADRRSVLETYGLPVHEALRREWSNGVEAHYEEGAVLRTAERSTTLASGTVNLQLRDRLPSPAIGNYGQLGRSSHESTVRA